MNRETDTVLLQTIGKFISLQVQQAIAPLVDTINKQADEIALLRLDLREQIIECVTSEVTLLEKKIDDLPKPEITNGKDGADGKDAEPVNYDTIKEMLVHLMQDEIAKFSVVDGKDGKDADMDSLFVYIENYIKAIPLPQNGRDGKDGVNGADGKQGPAGRDGADVVAAFRDSDRHLVLTLSNGMTKDVGLIHGADGAPGKDGKDGCDGFGFDEMNAEYVDGKMYLIFNRKNYLATKRFYIPSIVYRGVWRLGIYDAGDCVTMGGSLFIALQKTETKPDTDKSDWRLAVKKGLNGSNGAEGPQGKQGPPGKDGRDLTQLGQDGKKWG